MTCWLLALQSLKHILLFVKKDHSRQDVLVTISITLACYPPSVVAVEMKFENYKVI